MEYKLSQEIELIQHGRGVRIETEAEIYDHAEFENGLVARIVKEKEVTEGPGKLYQGVLSKPNFTRSDHNYIVFKEVMERLHKVTKSGDYIHTDYDAFCTYLKYTNGFTAARDLYTGGTVQVFFEPKGMPQLSLGAHFWGALSIAMTGGTAASLYRGNFRAAQVMGAVLGLGGIGLYHTHKQRRREKRFKVDPSYMLDVFLEAAEQWAMMDYERGARSGSVQKRMANAYAMLKKPRLPQSLTLTRWAKDRDEFFNLFEYLATGWAPRMPPPMNGGSSGEIPEGLEKALIAKGGEQIDGEETWQLTAISEVGTSRYILPEKDDENNRMEYRDDKGELIRMPTRWMWNLPSGDIREWHNAARAYFTTGRYIFREESNKGRIRYTDEKGRDAIDDYPDLP